MRVSDVKNILRSLGMRADKRLGQHFLIDERIARRQVEFASIGPEEVVLEIGPGLGVLTRLLFEKSRNVIAVEKDRRLCSYLEKEMPGVNVIKGDALKAEIPRFDVVVSNLPYQISSPITFRLLEMRFDRAVLMFQREFAERVVAIQGDNGYSRLSVQVYYRSEAEIIEDVPRSAFYPPPEVDSSLVLLRPRPPPFTVKDDGFFKNVVDCLFQHRRKTIENALSLSCRDFRMTKEAVREAVNRSEFSGKRVEELRPEEIGRLSDFLLEPPKTGVSGSGFTAKD